MRGNIWAREKQVCFVLYCVLVGPPIGFLLLVLTISSIFQTLSFLNHGFSVGLLLMAYYLGGLQALLSALLICWRYTHRASIKFNDLILCSIVGWVFGNWWHYGLAWMSFYKQDIFFDNRSYVGIFTFTFTPLVFGALLTVALWYIRPKKWVGP